MSTAARILRHKAVRDLRRRRAQLVAVAVTVGIGVAVFIASYDAYRNLEISYQQVYDDLAFADLWVTGGDVGAVAAAARDDDGVLALTERVQADVPMEIGDRRLVGRVITIPGGHQPEVNQLRVSAGEYPADAGGVVVEQHAADALHLAPGDRLRLLVDGQPADLSIVAVATSAEYLWPARSRDEIVTVPEDFAVVFVPESLAASAGVAGPRQLVVRATPGAVARLTEVAARAGAIEVYERAEQPSDSTLAIDVQGFGEMAVLFPVLFLTAAGLAAYVLLARLVQLDRPVIGTLVANGVSRAVVLRHYAFHSAAAVFAGALPGMLAGEALAAATTRVYTAELDIPVTATRFRPLTLLASAGFALVTAAAAGVGPARAAASTEPADAMRPPAPPAGRGRSLLERSLPWSLPRGGRLVLRNLWRRPRRTISTAAGTMLAVLVVVTSAGLDDSMRYGLARQFEQIDRRDLTVVLDHVPTTEEIDQLTARPDIAVAEPTGELPTRFDTPGATGTATLQLLPPDTVLHGFDHPFTGGLVLPRDMATDLGASVGAQVHLTAGTVSGRVTVAQVVVEPLAATAYLDSETWESLGGRPAPAVAVRAAEGADPALLRDRLQRETGAAAVIDHHAVADAVRRLMGLFSAFVLLMIAFGVLLAISLIFNAVTVTIGERTTEVATFAANGIPARRINRWIATETLLVVAAALIPGLVLGGVVSAGFLRSLDTGAFTLEPHIAATTWLEVATLVLVAALAAHVGPLRRLKRLDLAAVARERQS